MNIRLCKIGDEDRLSLLGQATFLESFAGVLDGADTLGHCAEQHSSAVYRGWLEQANARTWIAEIEPGRAPIGYLVLVPPLVPITDLRAGDVEVKRLYLLHRFQGQGIGQRLMEEAMAYARSEGCRRVLLEVYSGNGGAIAFYQKLGFVSAGKRSFKVVNHSYEHTTMALVM